MKLSIRLQNHGCANHPYWWIVVSPNRKNLKGRFLEHVGYWAPRQGAIVERQITLNMPRIKYWMGNGAVPTPKVQKFLSLWDLMPKPFYVESTKPEKAEEDLTEKDKIKADRRRKREERLKLDYINYHAPMAKYKSLQTYSFVRHRTKLREKIHAAERENQILRELLLHNEFIKINRINELSGHAVMDDSVELLRLEGELGKAKAELALLDKNIKNASPMQKIEIMKGINSLVDSIRSVEKQRAPFRNRDSPFTEGENVTKRQLDSQLEYELISKKIDKMNKEMELLDKLYEVVTLEEYANFLKIKEPRISSDYALEFAQDQFVNRGKRNFPPLTKYDLYFDDELQCDPDEILEYDDQVTFETYRASIPNSEVEAAAEEEETNQNEEFKELEAGEDKGEESVEEPQQKEYPYPRVKHEREQPDIAKRVGEQIGADLEAENDFISRVHEQNLLKFIMMRPDVIVPTNRPVHPFPDLETYVPEEYYEPISDLNLKVVHLDSLEANDELLKYHEKREYASNKSSKGLKNGKGLSSRNNKSHIV